MPTYRIKFTVQRNDSLDFDAPGEAEALEAFWLFVHRRSGGAAFDGHLTNVEIFEKEVSPDGLHPVR